MYWDYSISIISFMSHIAQGQWYTPRYWHSSIQPLPILRLYLEAGGYMQYRVNTRNKLLQPLSVVIIKLTSYFMLYNWNLFFFPSTFAAPSHLWNLPVGADSSNWVVTATLATVAAVGIFRPTWVRGVQDSEVWSSWNIIKSESGKYNSTKNQSWSIIKNQGFKSTASHLKIIIFFFTPRSWKWISEKQDSTWKSLYGLYVYTYIYMYIDFTF